MQDWAVAVILLAVSIVVTALLIALCRHLGGRPWIVAWLTGDKEEKAQLAKSDQNSLNGYVVNSGCTVSLDGHDHYRNEFLNTPVKQEMSFSTTQSTTAPITRQWSWDNEKTKETPSVDRRFSLDLDLQDILGDGYPSRLRRAMSCDSVSSDTSVVLDALDSPEHFGELEVVLQYGESEELLVNVRQARDLVVPDPNLPVNSYVRVCLMPNQSVSLQTRVQINTRNPVYNEKFLFGIRDGELRKHSIVFYVYICDKYSNTLLGECEIKLSDHHEISLQQPYCAKLSIVDSNQVNALGDLMFSLSFLPTAERLTVVIVKARNLQWSEHNRNKEIFIKVYLLQNDKKISKKKTSMKKDDENPVFNEAMIFSVPSSELQNIQLRLSVVEHFGQGKSASIGHIFVGSQCTGKSLMHWNQMMSSLRKPVALWHPIRK